MLKQKIATMHFMFLWAYSLSALEVWQFTTKYIFNEWQFLISLVILMVADTILGMTASWIRHELSSKGIWMIAKKVFVYFWILITLHVMTYFIIHNEDAPTRIFSWVTIPFYTAMVLREVISIFENAGKIDPRIIPTVILKRLKQFDENGRYIEDSKTK